MKLYRADQWTVQEKDYILIVKCFKCGKAQQKNFTANIKVYYGT